MKSFITMRGMLGAVLALVAGYAQGLLASQLTARDVHIDVPLSNIAVEAFRQGEFVGPMLFPIVPVGKQSDVYYTINKDTWLRLPQSTYRQPKTAPRRVEFDVSSDTYFAHNYALAGENAHEVLANADNALSLRQRTARKVVGDLMLDMEVRIANKVTSISNIGSGVLLTGTAKWSNYSASDPVSDITTGHAFIRSQTGVIPNTLLMDWDTYQIARRHPVMLDMFKYTQGGLLNDAELKEVFSVERILISKAIRNTAKEGATGVIANVWGNNALLCHVDPAAPSLQTVTFGLGFRWNSADLPTPMQARVYDDPDPGKKVELTEVGYYQDEKIVAAQLAYLVGNTL